MHVILVRQIVANEKRADSPVFRGSALTYLHGRKESLGDSLLQTAVEGRIFFV